MDPSRVAHAIIESLSNLSGPSAYCMIIGILFICGLGIPIPEDITLLVAGLLSAAGSISLTGALVAGFIGVMAGDSLLFFMGRRYGRRIFSLPGLRRIFTPERTFAAEDRIRRNGPFICFIARFLPGLRSPVFAMAGALGVRPSTFFLLDGFAAMISVPVWVYLGHWFGSNFDRALETAQQVQIYIFIGLILCISAYVSLKLWKRKRLPRSEVKISASVSPSVPELHNRE